MCIYNSQPISDSKTEDQNKEPSKRYLAALHSEVRRSYTYTSHKSRKYTCFEMHESGKNDLTPTEESFTDPMSE